MLYIVIPDFSRQKRTVDLSQVEACEIGISCFILVIIILNHLGYVHRFLHIFKLCRSNINTGTYIVLEAFFTTPQLLT